MAYQLYLDKSKLFECDIKLNGASIKNTTARLVLENSDYNIMFYGKVDSEGKCSIPIKKLKTLIEEKETGNIKLEVIAEETYFIPWQDTFEVLTSKSVQVEIKNIEKPVVEEKKVSVQVKDDYKIDYISLLSEKITSMGLNYKMISENKKPVYNIMKQYFDSLNISVNLKKEFNELMRNLKSHKK